MVVLIIYLKKKMNQFLLYLFNIRRGGHVSGHWFVEFIVGVDICVRNGCNVSKTPIIAEAPTTHS